MDDTQVLHAMTLDDAYHVETTLARGARGVTELVTLGDAGPFVRKRIPLQLARRDVWAKLNDSACPRLPHVQATYELPDLFVVVTDYVPGRTLAQVLADRGRLPEGEALAVIRQVGQAVRELHRLGIVHRDITPANVILADDGAHLIDLGIAGTMKSRPDKGRDTVALGTFGFASPEQYGFARTDFRSDIYSLGRLLGTMLTGAYPDDSAYDRLLADPSVVPARLSAAIGRACAFEPSSRQQDVDAFLADLERDGDGPQTPQQGASGPAALRRVRRRWRNVPRRTIVIAAVAAALIVILTAAGVTAAGVLARRAEPVAAGSATTGTAAPTPADKTPSFGADAGAGDGDGSAGGSDEASASPLKIVESGWSVDDQGYVHYAVGVRNTGTKRVELPAVRVTGRAKDGTVLFTTEDVYSLVDPGTVMYCGGQAGDGKRPATVDFEAVPPQPYAVDDAGEPFRVTTRNLSAVPGDYGVTFTGEIGATGADDVMGGGEALRVFVLLRDAGGRLRYAESTFVTRPSDGGMVAFSIPADDPPDYATYEIHAQPW
ncbi:serine/threonine protein kinase [Bifidobacterium pullorum subsp. saeculare]|uniref:non-specific serine/threonine protein kinase n=1 Tax=Bifidobacterium pullorum subsp. saeculare TaxID=78257 RepID=A0A939B9B4_9BIFI|nr:serine/threonine-protein kinase [Bifidobacterium pullorum]MBM6699334.1 serine/threonine protein kinase [Bifidobacterium pullorum subsp. saeculare]